MNFKLAISTAVFPLCVVAGQVQAQVTPPFAATTVVLAASGQVRIRPDIGSLNLGVSTEAPTAQAASQENTVKMAAVMAALRGGGVAERDIQTTGFNLNPTYRPRPEPGRNAQPPERTGYQATNSVTVTVRDLTRAATLLDAAMAAGANQVRGLSFRLDDPTPAQDAAREEAVKALEAKANLYARATGYRVSRLVNLTESGPGIPPLGVPPVGYGASDVVVNASSLSPGELTVRINLGGVYELTR
jgi:uncharacterized protein YggE